MPTKDPADFGMNLAIASIIDRVHYNDIPPVGPRFILAVAETARAFKVDARALLAQTQAALREAGLRK